jgi:AcrR family transcriptional regulator
MSAVAARAGVGISALYRRYASKEDLLREVARQGLQRYLEEAEVAAADDRDAWTAFATFMTRILDAEVHAITINLAGTFVPDDDLMAMSMRAAELNERIVGRTKTEGGLRPDVAVDDLSLIHEQVSAITLGDDRRTRELRHRYLALFLDGLRSAGVDALPGPPPTPDELASRWSPRTSARRRASGTETRSRGRQVKDPTTIAGESRRAE